ncbi:MAG: class I SAM-dependent methyltransferase [Chloroflexota bacterium]|nr:class I SAM-dependent methyltransferase [Chloroflexota bacterium]
MSQKHTAEETVVRCVCCHSQKYQVLYEDNHQTGVPSSALAAYSISSRQFGRHGRLVRCQKCGLVYMNPRPTQQALLDSYGAMVDEYYLVEESARLATLEHTLRTIEPLAKGRLLEVGCATGYFLKIAREHGWEVLGVEPCRWAADLASQRFGLPVLPGTLESAALPDNHFDVVAMLDLIEHLHDPLTTLARAHHVLRDGGLLVMSTPNVGSLLAGLLRGRWWCIMDEHLNYFSPKTMGLILQKTGFSLLKVQSYPRSFSLGYWTDRIYRWNRPLGGVLSGVVGAFNLQQRSLWLDLHDQMMVIVRKDTPSETTPERA